MGVDWVFQHFVIVIGDVSLLFILNINPINGLAWDKASSYILFLLHILEDSPRNISNYNFRYEISINWQDEIPNSSTYKHYFTINWTVNISDISSPNSEFVYNLMAGWFNKQTLRRIAFTFQRIDFDFEFV
jgi:hypothetical protein